ncbi:TetR/AcrR family transcriptional regulator [Granulicella tundricola]|uniref:TetR/AcrR family transcriptional regulator n=1 Tax=Granulicella tundricola TaxID=940615 RepID=UPI001E3257EC|nr:helix-turn-helix domain-containing protein [Granulicella tundricola]
MAKAIKQRLTRQESRLETRTKLLESAAQLFARGGYEGASVDLIAESAGYSKGAFYSNFESKEAIFLELLDIHKRREIDALAALLAQDIPASELLSLIRSGESGRGSDFRIGLLSAEFQLQACRDKTFAKTYAKLHRTHRDTMAGLVVKLFAKLARTPPSAPKDLADIIMGLTTGLSLQETSVQGPLRKGFINEAILLVLGLDRVGEKRA